MKSIPNSLRRSTKLSIRLTVNLLQNNYSAKAQKIRSIISNVTTRLDEIEREYQTNFARISSEFTTINATIQVLVSNMVRHDVDSILAQRTQSVSDESDESDQHSVANNSEASNQSESSHASSYSGSSSSNSSFFENVETRFK